MQAVVLGHKQLCLSGLVYYMPTHALSVWERIYEQIALLVTLVAIVMAMSKATSTERFCPLFSCKQSLTRHISCKHTSVGHQRLLIPRQTVTARVMLGLNVRLSIVGPHAT